MEKVPESYTLQVALKGEADEFTLKVGDRYIHSKYSPMLEARKSLSLLMEKSFILSNFCFFGIGLGYLAELFIKKMTNVSVILVEPDIFIFILFLASRELDVFFSHNSLVLLPATSPSESIGVLEALRVRKKSSFYFKACLDVSNGWMEEFETLRMRHRKKNELNCNTLKKFYIRWFKNFIKNIDVAVGLEGVVALKNAFANLPSIIFAAGPSLDEHIEKTKDIQDDFIIIAVDTSLKALILGGIIPDFVILMDGQYFNYLHIAGIRAKESVLVTEVAVYPSVFREEYMATYLSSSFFPLGKYMEDFIERKGALSAGGSVATTAWDLARMFGCNPIIMAGLDLAFTNNKTHSSLCHFENEAMLLSNRFEGIEGLTYRMIDVKHTSKEKGYKGEVITDAKMKMFAWWFESKIEEYPNIEAYNFEAQGLKIPNMPAISSKDILKFTQKLKKGEKRELIKRKIKCSHKKDVVVRDKVKNIFLKVCAHFREMQKVVESILNLMGEVEREGLELITQLDTYNEKIKQNAIYQSSGFDAIILSIENEIEECVLGNEKIDGSHNDNSYHIKKILDYYTLLKKMLEEGIRLMEN